MSSYLLLYRKIRDRGVMLRLMAGINEGKNKVTGVACEEFDLFIKGTRLIVPLTDVPLISWDKLLK